MKRLKTVCLKLSLTLFLGVFFIYYFYQNNPSEKGTFFLKCPSKALLNIYCPGCGSQRAIHQLLHFNFGEAMHYNPMLVILFPFVLYIFAISLINFVFNKKIRIKLLYKNWLVWLLFITIILFGILRNIPYEPFIFLAPKN